MRYDAKGGQRVKIYEDDNEMSLMLLEREIINPFDKREKRPVGLKGETTKKMIKNEASLFRKESFVCPQRKQNKRYYTWIKKKNREATDD